MFRENIYEVIGAIIFDIYSPIDIFVPIYTMIMQYNNVRS